VRDLSVCAKDLLEGAKLLLWGPIASAIGPRFARQCRIDGWGLIALDSSGIGGEWIAETDVKSNWLNGVAVKEHFGPEDLQPFMRTSVIRTPKLTSSQTRQARHSARKTAKKITVHGGDEQMFGAEEHS
jgi:hypothetical protein